MFLFKIKLMVLINHFYFLKERENFELTLFLNYKMHNNQADLIFLIETTGFIGVCFDQIKEKYLNPILESLWGYSLKDEIGVINDVS